MSLIGFIKKLAFPVLTIRSLYNIGHARRWHSRINKLYL